MSEPARRQLGELFDAIERELSDHRGRLEVLELGDADARLTEDGEPRVTEDGEARVTES